MISLNVQQVIHHNGFYWAMDEINEEIMISRGLASTPQEEEAFMILHNRARMARSRFETK